MTTVQQRCNELSLFTSVAMNIKWLKFDRTTLSDHKLIGSVYIRRIHCRSFETSAFPTDWLCHSSAYTTNIAFVKREWMAFTLFPERIKVTRFVSINTLAPEWRSLCVYLCVRIFVYLCMCICLFLSELFSAISSSGSINSVLAYTCTCMCVCVCVRVCEWMCVLILIINSK